MPDFIQTYTPVPTTDRDITELERICRKLERVGGTEFEVDYRNLLNLLHRLDLAEAYIARLESALDYLGEDVEAIEERRRTGQ